MSRTQEWLKNLFNVFTHHERNPPGEPARFDKDMDAHGKDRITGRGDTTSGGTKIVSEKQAQKLGTFSPFDKGGGGGGL
jgi:hypothetical protein